MLLKRESKQAIEHLQKAVAAYPKFVSAHNDLGLAYLDLNDADHAKQEFESAATLDQKFAQSFVNLGRRKTTPRRPRISKRLQRCGQAM